MDYASANILTNKIQEDLVYRPRTKETRLIYEQFLSVIQRHVGDLSTDEMKSAADEVLAVLKDDSMNDNERKREAEAIVDRMSDEHFNTLTILAQQLVDYEAVIGDEGFRGEREEIIDVNVELDEEESDDDQDGAEADDKD